MGDDPVLVEPAAPVADDSSSFETVADSPELQPVRRSRQATLVAALLILVFLVLAVGSIWNESVTGDEVAHLPSGYTYVKTGDFRLNQQHPPLIKMLAGLPLLAMNLKPVDTGPGWEDADEWAFGRDFLVNNSTPTKSIVFLARLPMILVGALLCFVVWAWARDLWGEWSGIFVLVLCVFCPNVLAHTPLVTTDIGLATFTVLTLYMLWKYSRTRSFRWLAACAVALGLALLAKYSAVVTVAVVGLLLPIVWLSWMRNSTTGVALHVVVAAMLFTLIPAAMITFGFGFPEGLVRYYHGLTIIHADLNPHWEAFLWGEYSRNGYWYYYLLAQLWKTPLPTLLCFAFALFLVPLPKAPVAAGFSPGRGSDQPGLKPAATPTALSTQHSALSTSPSTPTTLDWLFLLLPFAAFHGAGLLYKSSIGVRHILPAYPFLFLIAGATAVWALGKKRRSIVLGILTVWLMLGTVRVFPFFIPYFNELVGGPEHGNRYLDDSNVEWGQDLDRLKAYIDREKLEQVRLSLFKAYRPEHYGIRYEFMSLKDVVWPQPGITYFVGASYLQRNSLFNEFPGVRFHWLDLYEPVDKIGWSIFAYRISTDPAERDTPGVYFLPKEKWFADAMKELQKFVGDSPKFVEARAVLAEVLATRAAWNLSEGRVESAMVDVLSATRANPSQIEYRRYFANLVRQSRDQVHIEESTGPDAYYLQAFQLDAQAQPEQALLMYLRTLRLDPNHLGAHFNLGQMYARLGFMPLAAAEWQRCLEIDPGYAPAEQSLAHARQIVKRPAP